MCGLHQQGHTGRYCLECFTTANSCTACTGMPLNGLLRIHPNMQVMLLQLQLSAESPGAQICAITQGPGLIKWLGLQATRTDVAQRSAFGRLQGCQQQCCISSTAGSQSCRACALAGAAGNHKCGHIYYTVCTVLSKFAQQAATRYPEQSAPQCTSRPPRRWQRPHREPMP